MAQIRTDRRREPRTKADITVQVWGIDVRGERFLQDAKARDISLGGALLSELETEVRSGDVIGILYVGRKARYKVIWVRYCGDRYKVQAAVHRVASDECPWLELLPEGQAVATRPQAPPGTHSPPERRSVPTESTLNSLECSKSPLRG